MDELVLLVRLLVEVEEVEVVVEADVVDVVAFVVEEEHADVVLPEAVVGVPLVSEVHEEVLTVARVVEEIVFQQLKGDGKRRSLYLYSTSLLKLLGHQLTLTVTPPLVTSFAAFLLMMCGSCW